MKQKAALENYNFVSASQTRNKRIVKNTQLELKINGQNWSTIGQILLDHIKKHNQHECHIYILLILYFDDAEVFESAFISQLELLLAKSHVWYDGQLQLVPVNVTLDITASIQVHLSQQTTNTIKEALYRVQNSGEKVYEAQESSLLPLVSNTKADASQLQFDCCPGDVLKHALSQEPLNQVLTEVYVLQPSPKVRQDVHDIWSPDLCPLRDTTHPIDLHDKLYPDVSFNDEDIAQEREIQRSSSAMKLLHVSVYRCLFDLKCCSQMVSTVLQSASHQSLDPDFLCTKTFEYLVGKPKPASKAAKCKDSEWAAFGHKPIANSEWQNRLDRGTQLHNDKLKMVSRVSCVTSQVVGGSSKPGKGLAAPTAQGYQGANPWIQADVQHLLNVVKEQEYSWGRDFLQWQDRALSILYNMNKHVCSKDEKYGRKFAWLLRHHEALAQALQLCQALYDFCVAIFGNSKMKKSQCNVVLRLAIDLVVGSHADETSAHVTATQSQPMSATTHSPAVQYQNENCKLEDQQNFCSVYQHQNGTCPCHPDSPAIHDGAFDKLTQLCTELVEWAKAECENQRELIAYCKQHNHILAADSFIPEKKGMAGANSARKGVSRHFGKGTQFDSNDDETLDLLYVKEQGNKTEKLNPEQQFWHLTALIKLLDWRRSRAPEALKQNSIDTLCQILHQNSLTISADVVRHVFLATLSVEVGSSLSVSHPSVVPLIKHIFPRVGVYVTQHNQTGSDLPDPPACCAKETGPALVTMSQAKHGQHAKPPVNQKVPEIYRLPKPWIQGPHQAVTYSNRIAWQVMSVLQDVAYELSSEMVGDKLVKSIVSEQWLKSQVSAVLAANEPLLTEVKNETYWSLEQTLSKISHMHRDQQNLIPNANFAFSDPEYIATVERLLVSECSKIVDRYTMATRHIRDHLIQILFRAQPIFNAVFLAQENDQNWCSKGTALDDGEHAGAPHPLVPTTPYLWLLVSQMQDECWVRVAQEAADLGSKYAVVRDNVYISKVLLCSNDCLLLNQQASGLFGDRNEVLKAGLISLAGSQQGMHDDWLEVACISGTDCNVSADNQSHQMQTKCTHTTRGSARLRVREALEKFTQGEGQVLVLYCCHQQDAQRAARVVDKTIEQLFHKQGVNRVASKPREGQAHLEKLVVVFASCDDDQQVQQHACITQSNVCRSSATNTRPSQADGAQIGCQHQGEAQAQWVAAAHPHPTTSSLTSSGTTLSADWSVAHVNALMQKDAYALCMYLLFHTNHTSVFHHANVSVGCGEKRTVFDFGGDTALINNVLNDDIQQWRQVVSQQLHADLIDICNELFQYANVSKRLPTCASDQKHTIAQGRSNDQKHSIDENHAVDQNCTLDQNRPTPHARTSHTSISSVNTLNHQQCGSELNSSHNRPSATQHVPCTESSQSMGSGRYGQADRARGPSGDPNSQGVHYNMSKTDGEQEYGRHAHHSSYDYYASQKQRMQKVHIQWREFKGLAQRVLEKNQLLDRKTVSERGGALHRGSASPNPSNQSTKTPPSNPLGGLLGPLVTRPASHPQSQHSMTTTPAARCERPSNGQGRPQQRVWAQASGGQRRMRFKRDNVAGHIIKLVQGVSVSAEQYSGAIRERDILQTSSGTRILQWVAETAATKIGFRPCEALNQLINALNIPGVGLLSPCGPDCTTASACIYNAVQNLYARSDNIAVPCGQLAAQLMLQNHEYVRRIVDAYIQHAGLHCLSSHACTWGEHANNDDYGDENCSPNMLVSSADTGVQYVQACRLSCQCGRVASPPSNHGPCACACRAGAVQSQALVSIHAQFINAVSCSIASIARNIADMLSVLTSFSHSSGPPGPCTPRCMYSGYLASRTPNPHSPSPGPHHHAFCTSTTLADCVQWQQHQPVVDELCLHAAADSFKAALNNPVLDVVTHFLIEHNHAWWLLHDLNNHPHTLAHYLPFYDVLTNEVDALAPHLVVQAHQNGLSAPSSCSDPLQEFLCDVEAVCDLLDTWSGWRKGEPGPEVGLASSLAKPPAHSVMVYLSQYDYDEQLQLMIVGTALLCNGVDVPHQQIVPLCGMMVDTMGCVLGAQPTCQHLALLLTMLPTQMCNLASILNIAVQCRGEMRWRESLEQRPHTPTATQPPPPRSLLWRTLCIASEFLIDECATLVCDSATPRFSGVKRNVQVVDNLLDMVQGLHTHAFQFVTTDVLGAKETYPYLLCNGLRGKDGTARVSLVLRAYMLCMLLSHAPTNTQDRHDYVWDVLDDGRGLVCPGASAQAQDKLVDCLNELHEFVRVVLGLCGGLSSTGFTPAPVHAHEQRGIGNGPRSRGTPGDGPQAWFNAPLIVQLLLPTLRLYWAISNGISSALQEQQVVWSSVHYHQQLYSSVRLLIAHDLVLQGQRALPVAVHNVCVEAVLLCWPLGRRWFSCALPQDSWRLAEEFNLLVSRDGPMMYLDGGQITNGSFERVPVYYVPRGCVRIEQVQHDHLASRLFDATCIKLHNKNYDDGPNSQHSPKAHAQVAPQYNAAQEHSYVPKLTGVVGIACTAVRDITKYLRRHTDINPQGYPEFGEHHIDLLWANIVAMASFVVLLETVAETIGESASLDLPGHRGGPLLVAAKHSPMLKPLLTTLLDQKQFRDWLVHLLVSSPWGEKVGYAKVLEFLTTKSDVVDLLGHKLLRHCLSLESARATAFSPFSLSVLQTSVFHDINRCLAPPPTDSNKRSSVEQLIESCQRVLNQAARVGQSELDSARSELREALFASAYYTSFCAYDQTGPECSQAELTTSQIYTLQSMLQIQSCLMELLLCLLRPVDCAMASGAHYNTNIVFPYESLKLDSGPLDASDHHQMCCSHHAPDAQAWECNAPVVDEEQLETLVQLLIASGLGKHVQTVREKPHLSAQFQAILSEQQTLVMQGDQHALDYAFDDFIRLADDVAAGQGDPLPYHHAYGAGHTQQEHVWHSNSNQPRSAFVSNDTPQSSGHTPSTGALSRFHRDAWLLFDASQPFPVHPANTDVRCYPAQQPHTADRRHRPHQVYYSFDTFAQLFNVRLQSPSEPHPDLRASKSFGSRDPDYRQLRHVLGHTLTLLSAGTKLTFLHEQLINPARLRGKYPIGSLYASNEPIGTYRYDCGTIFDLDGRPELPMRAPFRSKLEVQWVVFVSFACLCLCCLTGQVGTQKLVDSAVMSPQWEKGWQGEMYEQFVEGQEHCFTRQIVFNRLLPFWVHGLPSMGVTDPGVKATVASRAMEQSIKNVVQLQQVPGTEQLLRQSSRNEAEQVIIDALHSVLDKHQKGTLCGSAHSHPPVLGSASERAGVVSGLRAMSVPYHDPPVKVHAPGARAPRLAGAEEPPRAVFRDTFMTGGVTGLWRFSLLNGVADIAGLCECLDVFECAGMGRNAYVAGAVLQAAHLNTKDGGYNSQCLGMLMGHVHQTGRPDALASGQTRAVLCKLIRDWNQFHTVAGGRLALECESVVFHKLDGTTPVAVLVPSDDWEENSLLARVLTLYMEWCARTSSTWRGLVEGAQGGEGTRVGRTVCNKRVVLAGGDVRGVVKDSWCATAVARERLCELRNACVAMEEYIKALRYTQDGEHHYDVRTIVSLMKQMMPQACTIFNNDTCDSGADSAL